MTRSSHAALRSVALCAALSALLFTPSAAGASAPPADDPPAPARSADERERERVLHFADGVTLRGRTRFVADHWELERSSGWHAFRSGAVLRARTLTEIRSDAKKRARQLRAGDLGARVAHAEWLYAEGLVAECLQQLDRVLREAPDHGAARAILARPRVRIAMHALDVAADELPAAVERLLDHASRQGGRANMRPKVENKISIALLVKRIKRFRRKPSERAIQPG